jgi:hypothetical protein
MPVKACQPAHSFEALSGTARYAAKDRAIAGRHLFGHQSKPDPEVGPFENASPLPIAATIALETSLPV